MSPALRIVVPCAGAALVLLAACGPTAHDYEAYVQHRATVEFGCDSVTVEQIDQYTYMATGCGCQATYDCIYSVFSCDRAPNLHPDACSGPADAGPG